MAGEGKIDVRSLNLYYGAFHALQNVSLTIPAHRITAFIGPSGCGKTTLLKTMDRMIDLVENARVEELMLELKENYTIVIVTHNMQQAARISDECGFFYLGQLVEYNRTPTLFTNPAEKRTEDYVSGRFG